MTPAAKIALRLCAAALAGALAAAPGVAQTPRLAPDFAMTVAVAGFEQPVEIRQSGLKRRVDVATDALVQTFITDRARGVLVVMTAAGRRRVGLIFPLAREETLSPLPLDLTLLEAGGRLQRVGGSNVAGRPCALWRYAAYAGSSGTACATAEGIVLQFTPDGRRTPLFQATRLTLARQDPKHFVPPPDYQLGVLPGVGGAVGPPPAPPAR